MVSLTKWRKRKKTTKALSVLKENCQALEYFVSKCTDKKAAFHCPLTLYHLAILDPSGKLYRPAAKHLLTNKSIKLSIDLIEKNLPNIVVHIYDGMVIGRIIASRKTWADLWRLLLKCFAPNRVHSPSKVHVVFDHYADN